MDWGYAPLWAMPVYSLMEYLVFRFVDTLLTVLAVVVVLAVAVRVLKLRGVSVRVERNCDQCQDQKIRGG